MAELANHFLTAKRERVDSGEMSLAMWAEYHRSVADVIEVFGRSKLVTELRPPDFARLRAVVAKRFGPNTLSKFITTTRSLFGYAYKAELIQIPVRFGNQFDKPPRRVMRLQRAAKGPKLVSAADMWKLLDEARPQLRAMILLAVNCGLGQKDCADLQRSTLAARPGWLDTHRGKTGIARRCPLWPETVQALEAVAKIRPKALATADGDCVFLTAYGNRWTRFVDRGADRLGINLDATAFEFKKLVKATKAKVPGGFYTLRHLHRTISDGAKDQPAAMLMMGHGDGSMSGIYRETIADERLIAVSNHIREWLLAGKESPKAKASDVLSFRAVVG